MKLPKKFNQRIPTFEIVEERLYGDAGTDKHWRAAKGVGIDVNRARKIHGRALQD